MFHMEDPIVAKDHNGSNSQNKVGPRSGEVDEKLETGPSIGYITYARRDGVADFACGCICRGM